MQTSIHYKEYTLLNNANYYDGGVGPETLSFLNKSATNSHQEKYQKPSTSNAVTVFSDCPRIYDHIETQ